MANLSRVSVGSSSRLSHPGGGSYSWWFLHIGFNQESVFGQHLYSKHGTALLFPWPYVEGLITPMGLRQWGPWCGHSPGNTHSLSTSFFPSLSFHYCPSRHPFLVLSILNQTVCLRASFITHLQNMHQEQREYKKLTGGVGHVGTESSCTGVALTCSLCSSFIIVTPAIHKCRLYCILSDDSFLQNLFKNEIE